MATQLVKKNFGGKRKGYKGSKWKKTNLINPTKWSSIPSYMGLDQLIDMFTPYSGLLPSLFKKGGRVRGVGKATHGYGRAMRKK